MKGALSCSWLSPDTQPVLTAEGERECEWTHAKEGLCRDQSAPDTTWAHPDGREPNTCTNAEAGGHHPHGEQATELKQLGLHPLEI